jgi:hypothetical protein
MARQDVALSSRVILCDRTASGTRSIPTSIGPACSDARRSRTSSVADSADTSAERSRSYVAGAPKRFMCTHLNCSGTGDPLKYWMTSGSPSSHNAMHASARVLSSGCVVPSSPWRTLILSQWETSVASSLARLRIASHWFGRLMLISFRVSIEVAVRSPRRPSAQIACVRAFSSRSRSSMETRSGTDSLRPRRPISTAAPARFPGSASRSMARSASGDRAPGAGPPRSCGNASAQIHTIRAIAEIETILGEHETRLMGHPRRLHRHVCMNAPRRKKIPKKPAFSIH